MCNIDSSFYVFLRTGASPRSPPKSSEPCECPKKPAKATKSQVFYRFYASSSEIAVFVGIIARRGGLKNITLEDKNLTKTYPKATFVVNVQFFADRNSTKKML